MNFSKNFIILAFLFNLNLSATYDLYFKDGVNYKKVSEIPDLKKGWFDRKHCQKNYKQIKAQLGEKLFILNPSGSFSEFVKIDDKNSLVQVDPGFNFYQLNEIDFTNNNFDKLCFREGLLRLEKLTNASSLSSRFKLSTRGVIIRFCVLIPVQKHGKTYFFNLMTQEFMKLEKGLLLDVCNIETDTIKHNVLKTMKSVGKLTAAIILPTILATTIYNKIQNFAYENQNLAYEQDKVNCFTN